MRVGIVGAGVAGTLLALRLRQARPRITVELYTAARLTGDATGVSGGLVRGFERSPEACGLAAQSLAELRGDRELSESAGYREIGSVYLLPAGHDPAKSVATVQALLPGSATVLTGADLRDRYPFRDLPAGTTAVAELQAGYLSPARLRSVVLARLASGGMPILAVPVTALETVPALEPAPALRLGDGTTVGYDAVVVAAGAWTPGLLAASGLPVGGLRTKHIQYTVHLGRPDGLGVFVDDLTGLYGRPEGDRLFLLGVGDQRWDVDPLDDWPDPGLTAQVVDRARGRLGLPGVRPVRTVVGTDCFHDPPGLVLRAAVPGAPVFTFTGGSGGAVKTALAASRVAATALLDR